MAATVALVAMIAVACNHTNPGGTEPTSTTAPGGESSSTTTGSTAPSTASTSTPTSSTSSTTSTVEAPDEPIHLFYSVHVHGTNDYMPYTSEAMDTIDPAEAEGLRSHILEIAEALEAHGARGSFHFVYGASQGLCTEYPDLIPRLLGAGHEVGVHAHRNSDVERAVASLETYCGVQPVTGSGLMAMANTDHSPQPGNQVITDGSLADSMSELAGEGVEQILDNIAKDCGHPRGIPEGAGNILYPWQPAYTGEEARPCEHDPNGDLVNIDHVSITEYRTSDGQADTLGQEQFDHLVDLFETAIAGKDESEAVVAWGFVTHTHEYVIGTDIADAADGDALAALDAFLDELEDYVSDGVAVWSTGAEIAELYRAQG